MSLLGNLLVGRLLDYLDDNKEDAKTFYDLGLKLGAKSGFDLAWRAVRWCIKHGKPTEARVRKALKL